MKIVRGKFQMCDLDIDGKIILKLLSSYWARKKTGLITMHISVLNGTYKGSFEAKVEKK
jgi:hypothetical protein